ncbi:hypothetical protein [Saccharothrix sp. ALI-22-I]|uniref:hypothetical protein n=1 Tax=Saccharothrix sp. ALI-22-I TaxID=1933778 RepID=UPI001179DE27|nr:hypothetical protein [Saccharothrix sp. ALI-22-I]
MSELGRAVTEKLKGAVPEEEVEVILRDSRVTVSAAVPTPVRLRVEEIEFSGVKRLRQPDADVTELTIREPFKFSWCMGPGLYVVGSHENLRGKSTVLEVIRWALRGRSRLAEDVRSWLEHVRVVFMVGEEHVIVDFAVHAGRPQGTVRRENPSGSGQVELARFDDEDAFEQAMDAVMMTRLHLQRIAAWQEDQAIEHAWTAYSGALSISSRGLDFLLGDIAYSGMASRLLQMFVGAAWAASRAQAATAVKTVEAAIQRLQQQADQNQQATAAKRADAETAVKAAQEALSELPYSDQLQKAEDAVVQVPRLGVQITNLRLQLEGLRDTERETRKQLQEEQKRKHAQLEDALARRFFNALRPTACPRCAAPVTEERRVQESQGHECSVCTTDLDLEAFGQEVLVAASAPPQEREAALRSATLTTRAQDDGEDAPEDGETALRQALDSTSRAADGIEAQLRALIEQRDEVAALVHAGGEFADLLQRRHNAELALARAQGALDALESPATPGEAAEHEVLKRRRDVLKAAEKVTAAWVQDAQREALAELSREIATLARNFGMQELVSVELGGGATLKVRKTDVTTPYSKCVPGEQLRLKVATAVALLRAGFTTQIGRHPGLLLVDSPGSEEATKTSLDAMLHALQDVAADSTQMQIIIATTRTELLDDLITEERQRVAPPGGYVW